MKTTVCQITSVHDCNDVRIYHKECRTLVNTGYKLILIATGSNSLSNDEMTVKLLPEYLNRFTRMLVGPCKVFRLVLQTDARIIHFHDPELILCGAVLKILGKKVIYDVHEDVPSDILSKDWIPLSLRKTISSVFKTFEEFMCGYFDVIITATPSIRDRFSRIGCSSVDINNYPLISELSVNTGDWSQKDRSVCYVGGIDGIRGVKEMVDAIELTDVTLKLAGTFSSEQLRNHVSKRKGWEKVIECGQVPRNEISRIMSKSIAGLILFHPVPNHVNAQPNKIFEYMAAGIPVIASDFPLWRELVENNGCGLCVNPSQPWKVAEAILWMADHPEEAEKMGQRGRTLIETQYNWTKEAEKLLQVYKGLE